MENLVLSIPKKNRAGFSLIELSIVVTIFIVMGTIFIVSQQQTRRSRDLRVASDSVQSVLRQMQNNVLSGEFYSDTALTSARDYGMSFSSSGTSYVSFAEESVTSNYKVLETFNFAQSVVFSNVQVTSGGVAQTATAVEIRFFPPFGEIRVTARNGPTILFTERKNVIVTFQISYSGTGQYRRLTVDGLSGRISEL